MRLERVARSLASHGLLTQAVSRAVLNVGVAIVGAIIARLIGTLVQVLLARWMGPTEFGQYTSLYAALGLIVVAANLGLDTWLLRQRGKVDSLVAPISHVFFVRLIVTGALMASAVIVLSVVGYAELTTALILAGALGLTFEVIVNTGQIALRTQIRNYAAAFLQVLGAALFLGLLWFFWSEQRSLWSAVGYRLVAGGVAFVGALWLLRRSLRPTWRPARWRTIIEESWAYYGAELLSNIALRVDLVLIAVILGATAAGIYGPALTIINTTFLVPFVAFQVLLPMLTRQERFSRGFRHIVGFALGGGLVYGIFLGAVLLGGSEQIIRFVLGAEYADVVPLLYVMSPIPFFKSINFVWVMIMVAYDYHVLRTKLLAVGSVFNVLANLVCIPLLGIVGAAWVNLGTEIVLVCGYTYGVWVTLYR